MTNGTRVKIFDCLACGEPVNLSLEDFISAELVTCLACGAVVDLSNVPNFNENKTDFIKLNNYQTSLPKENNNFRENPEIRRPRP
jgi:hypothetical protein